MPKPIIYQLVVRYFGNTNPTNQRNGSLATNGSGHFGDITEAGLSSLRDLGVTHLWLTGCLRQATLTEYSDLGLPADDPDVVKGIAGSFYGIRDAFDVCPDYALKPARRLEEFDALVERVHAVGFKLLLDFIPNHVARGYHSIRRPDLDFGREDDSSQFFVSNNHFFYLVEPPGQQLRLSKPAGWDPPGLTFDGSFPPEGGGPGHVPRASGDNCTSPNPTPDNWYETVKLNYGYNFVDGSARYDPRPRTWETMDAILAFWQGRRVDGFRCDMAHLVPGEAWQFLIGRARGRDPHCYFLAEAYPAGRPGAPIEHPAELLGVGFNAVYHSAAYDALKRIYQGVGSQDDYDHTITSLSPVERAGRLAYLENHDERRIASAIVTGRGPGESGFGSAAAGYQLAPLQFLFGPGPVLFFNGQEIGEQGAGAEGFSSDDGRTTNFDYWCMPELTKWVNGHAYDGGALSAEQRALRHYYSSLLKLCQDSAVCGDGYWGLKYFNRQSVFPDCCDDHYSFARYAENGGRLVLVVANFRPGREAFGRVRLPAPLVAAANLPAEVAVTLLLDRTGRAEQTIARLSAAEMTNVGLLITLPEQSCHVYAVG